MHMSDHGHEGTAQRFILERIDLLLARLESLGRQIRDTVARIVGTTVAEAVAEMIRRVTRFLPGRRSQRPRIYDEYGYDDGYDPYADEADPFGGPAPIRRADPVKPTSSNRCRRLLAAVARILIRWVWRVKNLRWPDQAVLLAGASSLLLWATDDGDSSTKRPSEIKTPAGST
jgi:hypothetical protein